MCWVLVAFDVDGCMMHSSMVYYPSGACGVRGLLAMPDAPLSFHLMRYWHCRCYAGAWWLDWLSHLDSFHACGQQLEALVTRLASPDILMA